MSGFPHPRKVDYGPNALLLEHDNTPDILIGLNRGNTENRLRGEVFTLPAA
jgi:hypothetical protein